MRITFPLWIVAASVTLLHVGGGQAVAQIELGGAASVSTIRDGTFALGGRLGIPLREARNMGVRLDAAVDYYWPSCSLADCGVTASQLNVVFENRIGGRAETYFGAGGSYQRVTLQQDAQTVSEGDFWGVNFVAGSRYSTQTALRPFIEVRWSLLDEIDNQWAVAFGATVALGR